MKPCHICGKNFPHPHDWFCSAVWAPVEVRTFRPYQSNLHWEYLHPETNEWVKIDPILAALIMSPANPTGFIRRDTVSVDENGNPLNQGSLL